ncbi:ribose-5-phosphate isomerase RpiA [Rhabdothermincola sp.]|uniref:ribose-5-phosphate isomerase RpiA n=1 Tax=Rhabdothermincola sp. TaxID=2820405 RepID=UPI002FE06E12
MSNAERPDPRRAQKEAAGRHAATYVEDGMRVGLGTGSTVHWTIVALGERRLDIACTATSTQTEELARSLGLRVVPPDDLGRLDVGIDGADEVDPEFNLTKGGGGALTREKIVGQMCERWIVVVDEHKLVDQLGDFGTPLEILPFAPGVVASRVAALGASSVSIRPGGSDNGNLLADARFGLIDDPRGLAARLDAIPGVVEHGIFLGEMVERVVVAGDGGIRELVNDR